MAQDDSQVHSLVNGLSSDVHDEAAGAWEHFVHTSASTSDEVRARVLGVALLADHRLVASAARDFLLEQWAELGLEVRRAACASLRLALERPQLVRDTWSFLADRWPSLPDEMAATVDAARLGRALDAGDLAPIAWDLLTTQWDRLPEVLRGQVDTTRLVAGLLDKRMSVISQAWDFLTENWPNLPPGLRSVLTEEVMISAAKLTSGKLALEEFVDEHGADLPPDIRLAADHILHQA